MPRVNFSWAAAGATGRTTASRSVIAYTPKRFMFIASLGSLEEILYRGLAQEIRPVPSPDFPDHDVPRAVYEVGSG